MKKIIILAALLTGCVTLDKLRTGDCRDVINNSPAITQNYFSVNNINSPNGLTVLCSRYEHSTCCLVFVEEPLTNKTDLMDGSCYLGDSKYRYKTFCEEK